MALGLEKIVFVFKVRIVPTSSEDSRTIIFACPHVLCFEKVQVAFGLALRREVTFTLETLNPSKGRLLTYVGGTLPRQRSWRPSGERAQRMPACSAAGWPPLSPPRPTAHRAGCAHMGVRCSRVVGQAAAQRSALGSA